MIYGFSAFGYDGSLVEVEAELKGGVKAVDIVGLADHAVKESRERMKSAVRNSGFEFPVGRVLISLSPADLKKDDEGLDLPVALAVLAENDDRPRSQDADVLVVGGLEPSGEVRHVKCVYAALMTARRRGVKYAIVPSSTSFESPDGMVVRTAGTLREAYDMLSCFDEMESLGDFPEESDSSAEKEEFKVEFSELDEDDVSLDDIEGMDGLKFAMAVAVSGRHSAIVLGSMGQGKTQVLERVSQLQPKLFPEEKDTVSRIRSIAGLECSDWKRPFRFPHYTSSIEGMCGGGPRCNPGEASLAHNGILFMDDAAEFRSSVLQMLRVPLESGEITLCRAGRSTIFPAKFQLLMATNPCPCGNFGSKEKLCLCSAYTIERYWKKFSMPLLDRIAIRFDCVNPADIDGLGKLSLEDLRGFVRKAYETQYSRQGKLNHDLSPKETETLIRLTSDAKRVLDTAAKKNLFVARYIANVKKVARTVEDMLGNSSSDEVGERSMKIAVALRCKLPFENLV